MSATWPRRFRCCGRAPEGEPARARRRHARDLPTWSSGCGTPAAPTRRAVLAAMLDHLDASGRFALLKLATGALRVGISARLAKQALADAFGLDVDAGRGGLARLEAALSPSCSPGAKAAAAADGQRRAGLPAVHARPPARGRAGLARRLCRRVEMGRNPGPARPCRRRDPALQPHRRRHFAAAFPTSPRPSQLPACSTANCWCAGDRARAWRRGGELQRAAAAARPQESSARRCWAHYPAFVRLYDILFDGEEDLRAAALDRAAGAARGVRRRGSTRTGSTFRS